MESESCIWLSPEARARLEGWVAGRNTPQKLVWRARIVLMWAQGAGVTGIIEAIGKTKRTAYRWRDRYLSGGVAGLERDATRPGRKPPLDAATIERVVNMTLNEKPPRGTHWSLRKMAKAVGLSHSSVQRIWAAHELKPHLTRSFKLSNDPKFCEKVQDIVGRAPGSGSFRRPKAPAPCPADRGKARQCLEPFHKNFGSLEPPDLIP